MVFVALAWIYVGWVTYGFGLMAIALLRNFYGSPPRLLTPPMLIWVGLVLVSCLNSYLYIVMNVGLVANAIVLAIPGFYGVLNWRSLISNLQQQWNALSCFCKQQPRLSTAFALVVVSLASLLLFRSAIAVFYTDTSIYHLQSIEWATRYPAVPGLGNFFHRLAFNSQWVLLNALFSFSFLFGYPVLTLNGLILLIALTMSLGSLIHLLNQEISVFHVFRCLWFFPLTYFIFNSDVPTASSPSTDLPAAIAIFILLSCGIQYLDDQRQNQDTRGLAALINLLIGFAITVRITSIPIGIFTLYSLYQESRKHGIKTGLLSLLPLIGIILPWLITNVILSGYLVVPITGLDVFNLDWKVPKSIYIFEQDNIIAWVRGFPEKIEEMKQLGAFGWVPTWFKLFRLTAEYRYLIVSAIAVLCGLFLYRISILSLLRRYALAYMTTAIGLLSWFLTTPEPRYAYGFLWGWILLLATAVVEPVLRHLSCYQRSYQATLLIVSIVSLVATSDYQIKTVALYLQHQTEAAYSVFSLKGGLVTGGEPYRYRYPANAFWVAPMKFPEFPIRQIDLSGQRIYITPEGSDLCGRAFPCSPYWRYLQTLPTLLQLRGTSLKEGFRMVDQNGVKP